MQTFGGCGSTSKTSCASSLNRQGRGPARHMRSAVPAHHRSARRVLGGAQRSATRPFPDGPAIQEISGATKMLVVFEWIGPRRSRHLGADPGADGIRKEVVARMIQLSRRSTSKFRASARSTLTPFESAVRSRRPSPAHDRKPGRLGWPTTTRSSGRDQRSRAGRPGQTARRSSGAGDSAATNRSR